MLAARIPTVKAIWHATGEAQAFDLIADPEELSPGALPEALAEAPEAHRVRIAAMASHRRDLPRVRHDLDPDPALTALGYQAPAEPTALPPWLP
jgi:hypothetical protein